MKPEEHARQQIDTLLEQAGWAVKDRKRLNLGANKGVAVHEFSMESDAANPCSLLSSLEPGVCSSW